MAEFTAYFSTSL